jgi:hypothetical protein
MYLALLIPIHIYIDYRTRRDWLNLYLTLMLLFLNLLNLIEIINIAWLFAPIIFLLKWIFIYVRWTCSFLNILLRWGNKTFTDCTWRITYSTYPYINGLFTWAFSWTSPTLVNLTLSWYILRRCRNIILVHNLF